jgi:hypothetical protein
MSALLELVVDLTQLRPHPLRYGDAPQLEPSFLRFSTQVCEAEEVERVGLPETAGRPLLGGVPPELRRVLSGCSSSPNLRIACGVW